MFKIRICFLQGPDDDSIRIETCCPNTIMNIIKFRRVSLTHHCIFIYVLNTAGWQTLNKAVITVFGSFWCRDAIFLIPGCFIPGGGGTVNDYGMASSKLRSYFTANRLLSSLSFAETKQTQEHFTISRASTAPQTQKISYKASEKLHANG
jgi:hypothetical protein